MARKMALNIPPLAFPSEILVRLITAVSVSFVYVQSLQWLRLYCEADGMQHQLLIELRNYQEFHWYLCSSSSLSVCLKAALDKWEIIPKYLKSFQSSNLSDDHKQCDDEWAVFQQDVVELLPHPADTPHSCALLPELNIKYLLTVKALILLEGTVGQSLFMHST